MKELTELIGALTNLINSLDNFVQNNGPIVYFGTLGFVLVFFTVYTIGKITVGIYGGEIERVVESRNKVHKALLEKRESSKKTEEKESENE